ncbi:hypothetical protein JRQ81_004614 [Phrynocephalus forsythii]|uniref:Uncharacterized protein n=1 Tax=Phrynocephalus forsythii TaxID=171643 RepID=A0A9Q0XGG2_9SAUR|nr:hypothetical protein JRQ81_004614 [Phrynocephalus forsythii]
MTVHSKTLSLPPPGCFFLGRGVSFFLLTLLALGAGQKEEVGGGVPGRAMSAACGPFHTPENKSFPAAPPVAARVSVWGGKEKRNPTSVASLPTQNPIREAHLRGPWAGGGSPNPWKQRGQAPCVPPPRPWGEGGLSLGWHGPKSLRGAAFCTVLEGGWPHSQYAAPLHTVLFQAPAPPALTHPAAPAGGPPGALEPGQSPSPVPPEPPTAQQPAPWTPHHHHPRFPSSCQEGALCPPPQIPAHAHLLSGADPVAAKGSAPPLPQCLPFLPPPHQRRFPQTVGHLWMYMRFLSHPNPPQRGELCIFCFNDHSFCNGNLSN